MVGCARVSKPSGCALLCSNHSLQLLRWLAALKGKVQPLKAIKCQMPNSITNLTRGSAHGFAVVRGIGIIRVATPCILTAPAMTMIGGASTKAKETLGCSDGLQCSSWLFNGTSGVM